MSLSAELRITCEASSQTYVQPRFLTTHWSVVLRAKDKTSPDCQQALETLCRAYWYPLYAHIRGSGYSPHGAQDLTQGFFFQLLSKDYLRVVAPEKGRFRTFLRMALKRFLVHEWDKVQATPSAQAWRWSNRAELRYGYRGRAFSERRGRNARGRSNL